MIHCKIIPTVTLTATITPTIRLTACAPQFVPPPPIEVSATLSGASSVRARGVCVRGASARCVGASSVRGRAAAVRRGRAGVVGSSLVTARARRVTYPEALPGAYSFYDAQDIAAPVGYGVEVWPDRIGGRDALTGPSYIPTVEVKDGVRHVAFDGSQWMFSGAAADWRFLHDGSAWAIGLRFWFDATETAAMSLLATTTGVAGSGFALQVDDRAGRGDLRFYGNGSIVTFSGVMARDSSFHTVLLSYESGVSSLYLDGLLVSSGNGIPSAQTTADYMLHIGNRLGGTLPLFGGISSFYTGTQPLSAAQVAAYHQWSLGQ